MIPTRQMVNDRIRSIVGDDMEIASGDQFTDADTGVIAAVNQAYEDMIAAMLVRESAHIRRVSYFLIPAYTTMLLPASMNISNMGEPVALYDRRSDNIYTPSALSIVPANANTGTLPYVDITISGGHTLVDGSLVMLYAFQGLTDDINSLWSVDVQSSTVIRLWGASPSGTWTAGSGRIGYSSDSFSVRPAEWKGSSLELEMLRPKPSISQMAWERGQLRLAPCSQDRQIQFQHTISSTAPSGLSASMGVDGSLLFLSHRAAGFLLNANGVVNESDRCNLLAWGPEGMDNPGGYLGALLKPGVKTDQLSPIISQPFRPALSRHGRYLRGWR